MVTRRIGPPGAGIVGAGMAKLTKRAIDSFRYRGGWDVRWDDDIPGFGVRLYPSGKRSFVLSYRNARRKKRLLVLGRYGADLTLGQARARVIKERGRITEGADPVAERKAARATALTPDATFREVLDSFIDKYAKPRQRTWKQTDRTLRVNCARWLDKPLSTITETAAYELLDGFIAQGQDAKARVTLAWLRTMFRWAAKRKIVERPIMDQVEIQIERKVRKRAYTSNEVKAVWKAATSLDPIEAGFVKLILLLGVRKSELAGMRRSEFDDPAKPTLWIVPHERTKTRKSQKEERVYLVPLPKLAQRIIKGLPRLDSDLVFPGRGSTKPTDAGKKALRKPLVPGMALKAKVRENSSVTDWTYHACRDTISTWLQDQGHSRYERGLILNHSEGGVTADYSHGYSVDLKRQLLEKWADHVARTVQPKGAVLLS